MGGLGGRAAWLIAGALIVLGGAPAGAERVLGGATTPAALVPWDAPRADGTARSAVLGGPDRRLRVGAGVGHRSYRVEVARFRDVRADAWHARALLNFVPFPRNLSPYAGLGVSFELLRSRDERLEDALRGLATEGRAFGLSAGGNAFLGLQMPLGSAVSVFAEGRAGVDLEVGGEFDGDLNPEDLGDVSGFAGLRLVF